jgi:hypothetical protein
MRTRWPLLLLATGLAALVAFPAAAEVVQGGDLIVSFDGSISPRALPRTGTVPVGVRVEGRVRRIDRGLPPSLRQISLQINRNGVLDRRGLPSCPLARLQASDSATALAACGPARVGSGLVAGFVVIPEQPPLHFRGRVLAFNGHLSDGRPAILAHLYSPRPLPLTFVLAFAIERTPGTFGTRLVATVPRRTRRLTHVTRFELSLRRVYSAGGARRSYLSAGCPAPAGFPGATFPLARATYRFDGEPGLATTLVRTCHVR